MQSLGFSSTFYRHIVGWTMDADEMTPDMDQWMFVYKFSLQPTHSCCSEGEL